MEIKIHLETNYSLGTGLNNTLPNERSFRSLIEIAQASFLKTEIKAVSICNAEANGHLFCFAGDANRKCTLQASLQLLHRSQTKRKHFVLVFLPDNCFVVWEYCANRTCIPQWSLQPPLHRRWGNDSKEQFRQKCSISETQMNKYSHQDRFVQTDISILVPFPLCFHFKSDNETFIWYGVFHIVCLPDSVIQKTKGTFWKQG